MIKEIEKETKWIITFSNGFCGCNIKEEFIGTYDEAKSWANKYLFDHAASCVFGWGEEYTEKEYEEYIEDCSFDIVEREEEDDD